MRVNRKCKHSHKTSLKCLRDQRSSRFPARSSVTVNNHVVSIIPSLSRHHPRPRFSLITHTHKYAPHSQVTVMLHLPFASHQTKKRKKKNNQKIRRISLASDPRCSEFASSFAFYVAGIPEGSDWFWRRAHPSQAAAVTHLSRTPRDNEWRNQNNNNNNTKEAQEKEKSAGGAHNGLFLARLLAFPIPEGFLNGS